MDNKKFTVAYFIIGSALKLNKNKILRSDGSSEYYSLLKLLLKNKNVGKILLLSKSDYGRLTESQRKELDPEHKIFDPYSEFNEIKSRKKYKNVEDQPKYYQTFTNVLLENNIKADFGLGFISQGIGTTTTLPGMSTTIRWKDRLAKCLDMTLFYASDIVYYLDITNMPWWLLATDPRYIKPKLTYRDVTNLPIEILGQQDFDIDWWTVNKLDVNARPENGDYSFKKVKSKYKGIEKMNLINQPIYSPKIERPYKFTIVSMQVDGNTNPARNLRFAELKKYIVDLDSNNSSRIFGKWDQEMVKDYPQFKGYIATEDLDNIFKETRYTLVMPTAAGWVTSKYAEMLQLGVLPFLHPLYDTQYHIVPKDHPIRINSPEDFYNKMEYYDAHEDERIELILELQDLLIKDACTGKFLLDVFNNSLDEVNLNFNFDISENSLYESKQYTENIRKECFIY
ncbi:MAG TPA: hypothetical protein PLY35_08345 [Thermotogota bacterium]|nr:hypothetical protein [Thermotogota bacterium]